MIPYIVVVCLLVFVAGFWDTQILHTPSVVFLLVHFYLLSPPFPLGRRWRDELLSMVTFTLGTDHTVDPSGPVPGERKTLSLGGFSFFQARYLFHSLPYYVGISNLGVTMTTRIVYFFSHHQRTVECSSCF